MDGILKRKLLTEYYETVSPLLHYAPCAESDALSARIFSLLADIFDVPQTEELLADIRSAAGLQVAADALLMPADGAEAHSPALCIKAGILTACGIERTTAFDADLLYLGTERDALAGSRYACKLLACMKWLGIGAPPARRIALEIWKTLAVCGEDAALSAVIFAARAEGDTAAAEQWAQVRTAVHAAERDFAPMLFETADGDAVDAGSLALANLILAAGSGGTPDAKTIDRAKAYYLLYGEDSFADKLMLLSGEAGKQDFHAQLYRAHQYKNRKFGF